MNAEQLVKLHSQASRLHFFLERDRNGWAPAGTDMRKLERIASKAWARCERRQGKLDHRLALEQAGRAS